MSTFEKLCFYWLIEAELHEYIRSEAELRYEIKNRTPSSPCHTLFI